MLTATLAITGFPPLRLFSRIPSVERFQTKRRTQRRIRSLWVGLATALLTSFYMFRLIFLTFHGKQRYDEHKVHVHESPRTMLYR